MFVFADSPQGSRDDDSSDASEGKAFLLHTANVKEANDPAARAVDDPSRLLERATSVINLARALLNVARNKGAAGVDGRSVEEIVAEEYWGRRRRDIASSYPRRSLSVRTTVDRWKATTTGRRRGRSRIVP